MDLLEETRHPPGAEDNAPVPVDVTSAATGDTVWTATGRERPVFLDERGRRRRWVFAGGAVAGGASAFWLTALIAGAIGFTTLPAMRASLPVAERTEARLVAQLGRHNHVSGAATRRQSHQSTLERATRLAVSRAVIAAQ